MASQPALAGPAVGGPNAQTPNLKAQAQHDYQVMTSPAFWQAVHDGLQKIGHVSLQPGQAKAYSFKADGMTVVVRVGSTASTTASTTSVVHPMLPCPFGSESCYGSGTDWDYVDFYNNVGWWAAEIGYHVPYSWNYPAETDHMGYPYWTYSHAWFEALNNVSSDVYPLYQSGTYWASGGWFQIYFVSQYLGFNQAYCSASNYLDFGSNGILDENIYLSC